MPPGAKSRRRTADTENLEHLRPVFHRFSDSYQTTPGIYSALFGDGSGVSILPMVASAVVFKSVAISSSVTISSAQDCSRADMASYSFFLFRKAWAVAVCAEG